MLLQSLHNCYWLCITHKRLHSITYPIIPLLLFFQITFSFSLLCLILCVCSVVSDSLQPHDCNTPGSSVHGIFLRQEYWSGLPFLPPGDLTDPGMEAVFPTCPALAAGFFTTSAAWKAQYLILQWICKCFTQSLREDCGWGAGTFQATVSKRWHAMQSRPALA